MFTLPLLVSEDIAVIDGALNDLVESSGARLALFIDAGGFIVTKQGNAGEFDITTLGALAANNFAATQAIAKIIENTSVTTLYQEGDVNSLLLLAVEEFGFLAVVFASEIGVGMVKFYAADTVTRTGRQLGIAQGRAPAEGLDLSSLNIADATPLFRRRVAP